MFKPNRLAFKEKPSRKPEKRHELVEKLAEAEKATGREFLDEGEVQKRIEAAEKRINESPVNEKGKARMKKELARLMKYKKEDLAKLNFGEGSKVEDVYARTLIDLNGYMKDLGKFEEKELANEKRKAGKARAEKLRLKKRNEIGKVMDRANEMKQWAEFNFDKQKATEGKKEALKFQAAKDEAIQEAWEIYFKLIDLKGGDVDLSVLSEEEKKTTRKKFHEARKSVEKAMKRLKYRPPTYGVSNSGPLGH